VHGEHPGDLAVSERVERVVAGERLRFVDREGGILGLDEALEYLAQATGLEFTRVDQRFVTISRPGIHLMDICGILIDARNHETIEGAAIQAGEKFTASGQLLLVWGQFGDGPGEFASSHGLAVDPRDNIYILDFTGHPEQGYVQCPACGTAPPPGAAECPECGLGLGGGEAAEEPHE